MNASNKSYEYLGKESNPVEQPGIVPFPEKVKLSCVTKDKGPLTKIIKLDPTTGEVIKDGSQCSMSTGSIFRLNISSPAGFAKMLRSRESNQAIVHGVCEYEEARIVTKGKIKAYTSSATNPVIARTKEYLKSPDGPGVIMFDHDKPRPFSVGEEKALRSYTPTELLAELARVHPAIAKAAYVSTPSTSSCIYSATGELLRGEGTGSHIYLFVKNAKDIPRYLKVLGQILIGGGYGRAELSRSGAILIRTLIDLLVASFERLDFVAGAVCLDGLVQMLPEPFVQNGELLDTESLASLTEEEEKDYQDALAALLEAAKPNQAKVKAEYIQTETTKLVVTKNISQEDALKIVTSRQDHVLEDDDILYFSHLKEGIAVSEVLKDGFPFDGRSLADPLEPEYENFSKTKAKFFHNDGINPVINSFAHGSTKYTFRKFQKEKDEKRNQSDQVRKMFEQYIFLKSENKIIDTLQNDIREAMMIERAFIISEAGKFYEYTTEDNVKKSIPLTQYWMMSDDKKIAAALRYKPGEPLFFQDSEGKSYYNSFRYPYQLSAEMSVDERQQRLPMWDKLMDAVFHEHRPYIEDWFSFSIQHPALRSGIMPICISEVGLGKSLIMAIIGQVIGHQNFSNGKILDVTGLGKSGTQWGDWIFNKKISCIEEIAPEGDTGIQYKVLDALKDIITNETLSLNLKGGRNGTFTVYANIMGFSNHQNCVKIPYGDRRLYIVDSTGQKNLPQHEYGEIYKWAKDEKNIIAVFQYLLTRKISGEFIPGQAKMTDAKKSLQADGRSVMQTAFDLVKEQYPCDLIAAGELQRAVSQAMHHVEGGTGIAPYVNLNAEKQFQAIMKSCTTLVAGGNRINVQRQNGAKIKTVIRALRNGQEWISASNQEIQKIMNITVPDDWITTAEELDRF